VSSVKVRINLEGGKNKERGARRQRVMILLFPLHKNLVIAAGVLVLVSGMIAQTGEDSAASIAAALKRREFEQALQLLQPALQKFPHNPQLWMLKGVALAGKGDKKSALASFQSALKISPDYIPALEGAAQLEYDAGSGAAIPLLHRIIRLRPNDPTSHAMLAVLAYKNRNCATAVHHFDQTGALLDSQPIALQEYGACLIQLGEADKAIAVFRRLVASHPEDPRAIRSLAAAQLQTGRPQDALVTLGPLLQPASSDVSAMQMAAAAYEATKDTPTAVKILHEAIVKDPRNVALYVDFADIAMAHQSFQAGIDMMNAGLKLQPAAASLYLARGILYVQIADYEKAEADFAKAEQLDPGQSLSAAAQGLVAEETNQSDPDRALATVRAKLKKQPGDAFLWSLQAAILLQKAPPAGSPEFHQSVQSAKKAIALQPSLTVAHNTLAKLYLQSGQNALAIRECRLALQNSPKDQTALYHLILALRKTDDRAEIPGLLKRLAKARQDATREEAERNRYKLLTETDAQTN
jgi:tetratricopeptide (TPR) repeat protein